ncbi:MAG: hypothetical protein ABI684_12520 [Nitrospirota bacterium]
MKTILVRGEHIQDTRLWLIRPPTMFGMAAECAVTHRLQTNFYIINGYNYLSHPNNQFSYGTQVSYLADNGVTFTEKLYYGPTDSRPL